MEPIRIPECQHPIKRLCRFTKSNNTVEVREQCLTCGSSLRTLPKAAARDGVSVLPPWDEELRQQGRNERNRLWAEASQQQRDQENREWKVRYDAYMASPQWQEKRRKALERDNYLCQGCRVNRAVQVHHTTYARFGHEMLFDLVSVCLSCHRVIHPAKEDI